MNTTQSQDCAAAEGEGVDGFMNFYSCAQNLVMQGLYMCPHVIVILFRP